jgi:hypothetical protein
LGFGLGWYAGDGGAEDESGERVEEREGESGCSEIGEGREGVREEVAEDIEVTTSRRVENDAQGGLAGSKGAKEGDEAEAGWRGEEEAEATKAVERISEGRGRSKLS